MTTSHETPESFKSQRFYRVPGIVPSVPSVALTPESNNSVTVGTLGTPYSTRHGYNGIKRPIHALSAELTIGGGGMASGSAGVATLTLRVGLNVTGRGDLSDPVIQ